MTNGRLVIPLMLCLCASALQGEIKSPVRASITAETSTIQPGEVFTVDIMLDIEPGWHVYGPPSSMSATSIGLPTTITWDLPPGFVSFPLEWPTAERFSYGGIDSLGHTGKLRVRAGIRAPNADAITAGGPIMVKAKVEWLACKVECMPGEASLELSLPVAKGGSATSASGGSSGVSLALALLLAFAGGLILNLMPCVLPVLSLKAGYHFRAI